MNRDRRRSVAFISLVLVLGACAVPAPSGTSTASPPPSSPAASPSVATTSAPTPTAAPSPAVLPVGSTAVTVSDRLRVRSLPVVSDDSIMYEPVLPTGTQLTVVGGPADGSDYIWYEVDLPRGTLDDGITRGWVAMADHDGTPWIALAGGPIEGLEVAMSSVDRAPADPLDAIDAVASINAFAVDAYRRLLDDEIATTNAVFSPTSIALALGMVRAGARDATGAEMDEVLHTDGWEALGPGLNALSQALASRSDRWVDLDGAPREVALRIANTTFAQRNWTLEPDFLDRIAGAFGAGVNLVDYLADADAARRTINAWVKRETADRIPELLLPPDVTSDTRLYLVNAIYLKAEWDKWFDDDGTEARAFTRLDGSKVDVPTMATYRGALTPITPVASGDGWTATELRYRTRDEGRLDPPLAMTLIRPDDLAEFEAALSARVFRDIVAKLDAQRDGWFEVACPGESESGCYPYDLTLYLPRFGIETRASLGRLLQSLGMPTAFDPAAADLTGIHRPESLDDNPFIKNVIHQANIDVDEKGTEAAAATAVGVDTGGGPSALDEITLRFDRPFLFLLRDVETGAILFMGRVVDPSIGR